jgi:hypothetical protein
MLKLKTLRFALLIFTLAIAFNMALSSEAFAKQRRGRFDDKKDGKFINGHDARDGRWDGRGPSRRFGDRRDHDERFRFGDRRDHDERFRFRDRRDRDERRDRWRDDDRHRRRVPHWRR